jgi:hypothetical protein
VVGALVAGTVSPVESDGKMYADLLAHPLSMKTAMRISSRRLLAFWFRMGILLNLCRPN